MKKKDRINMQRVIIVFIIIYILSYMLYSVFKLSKNPTNTMLVENGKIYMEEIAQGYIIRDEVIVKGENYKNGMEKIKSEGDKVAKGEPIFRYYTNNEDELRNNIKKLDEKIQEALKNETDLFSSDIKLIDKQIENKLGEIYKKNDIQEVKELKKQINTLITKKAKISGDLSPSGSYLKKLISERAGYENKLNSESEKIIAPTSGVISYRIDGLEDKFNTGDFDYLSGEFLENLSLKTGQLVSSNEESGKIVNNYKCYIASLLTSNEAKQAKENDIVKIRLSSSDEISAKMVKVCNESNGKVLIVFEITNNVESLIEYRKVSFNIIWWGVSGLKISNMAIIKEGDLNYVKRNREGYIDKILVKVVKQDNDYSIIKSYTTEELKGLGYTTEQIKSIKKINVYDEILLKP
ncbi:MAG: HlyD family efflux transporter periplasmic adaptor subunit [Clostridia bacterium]|nr:HlyD family efflux transporter periplasmic adaptor subunit [Clostridia bacterium]